MGRTRGANQRDKVTREAHKKQMVLLYTQGQSIYKIADALGIHFSTVSKELKAIRQAWVKEYLEDFNEAKARELAKLDALEEAAWDGWRRSQLDKETKGKKQLVESVGGGADSEDEAQGDNKGKGKGKSKDIVLAKKMAITEQVSKSAGEIEYLKEIREIVALRCKILGAFAPVVTVASQRTITQGEQGGAGSMFSATEMVQIYLPDNGRGDGPGLTQAQGQAPEPPGTQTVI